MGAAMRDREPMTPLPPLLDYAPPTGRYFVTVWDTTDIPVTQELDDGSVLITPTFDNLVIWGREVGSSYEEDQAGLKQIEGVRVMGEWFSNACPEGELGTHPVEVLREITEQTFSAAYEKGWE